MLKISTTDILYIRSDSDYTEIHTATGRLLSNQTLKHWLAVLDPSTFCQVHKSTIVNLQHIHKVTGNVAYMDNTQINIGRAYKEGFLERWGLK